MTECIRQRSNERHCLATLAGLVGELSADPANALFVDTDSLRDYLEAVHVGHDIAIVLELSENDAAALMHARQILSSLLGAETDVAATISALLFSYLVRRTATATRATLAEAQASGKQQHGERGGNVVSFTERTFE